MTYLETGFWSEEATKEAEKFGPVHKAWNHTPDKYLYTLPDLSDLSIPKDSKYFYYCDNETIHGLEYPNPIELEDDIPIVCDMSSNICSRPIDWDKFGVVYACA